MFIICCLLAVYVYVHFVPHIANKIFVLTLYFSDESKLMKFISKSLVNEIHSLDSGRLSPSGPFGHNNGRHWHYDFINGIDVKYTKFIQSLTFEVEDTIGNIPQHGKQDGYQTYKVVSRHFHFSLFLFILECHKFTFLTCHNIS